MNQFFAQNRDLRELAESLSQEYQKAEPFPNISIDNFFDPTYLEKVLSEFPDLSKKNGKAFENHREVKLAGKGERFFEENTRQLMHFLNSEPFLEFLQILTGINEPLIGDPYYFGGGQHEIKRGGFLKVHADFNKHNTLGLDRRINLLIYLNKDWKEEYGGHFELWDKEMKSCKKKILPLFNRIAIFSTTSFSYHGHPDKLNCPENRSRKSLALYYYTNGRPKDEIVKGLESHTTIFKQRKNVDGDVNVNKYPLTYKLKHIAKDWLPPILLRVFQR